MYKIQIYTTGLIQIYKYILNTIQYTNIQQKYSYLQLQYLSKQRSYAGLIIAIYLQVTIYK